MSHSDELSARRCFKHAGTVLGSHFLLDILAEPERKHIVAGWNARIHQFRESLNNPDEAPIKAAADLRCGQRDAEKKLSRFFAEMTAVAHTLKHLDCRTDFSILLPGDQPMPDIRGWFPENRAAIEVKNLQSLPIFCGLSRQNIGKQSARADPDRYGFRAILRHQHCRKLAQAAPRQSPQYSQPTPGYCQLSVYRRLLMAASIYTLSGKMMFPRTPPRA